MPFRNVVLIYVHTNTYSKSDHLWFEWAEYSCKSSEFSCELVPDVEEAKGISTIDQIFYYSLCLSVHFFPYISLKTPNKINLVIEPKGCVNV